MALIMSNNQAKKVEAPKEQAQEVPKKKYIFTERDIDRKDKHILEFHLFVPEGTKIDEVQQSDCWAHIAYKLQPMAQITVTEKSGAYVALLYVISNTKLSAVTELIWYKELSANADRAGNSEFEVVWINQQDKFGVKRKSDNVLVTTGLDSAAEASISMGNEIKSLKGG